MKALIISLVSLLPGAAFAHSAAPHVHGSDWKVVAFSLVLIGLASGLKALTLRKTEARHDPR